MSLLTGKSNPLPSSFSSTISHLLFLFRPINALLFSLDSRSYQCDIIPAKQCISLQCTKYLSKQNWACLGGPFTWPQTQTFLNVRRGQERVYWIRGTRLLLTQNFIFKRKRFGHSA